MKTLMNDEAELQRILKRGAEKAEAVASQTLNRVYKSLGVVPRG
jgi:hypothetical protein